MRFFTTRRIILISILLLAAILRLWNINNVPPSASLDEASIGYNAYSVLKTGGDEYGELPVISQRGYDDYRRSTYLFLVIPFVALFDLNVVSVRLPAVILSILTVLSVYFIVLELLKKQEVAFFSSFLLAISPWHVYISRLGHESNACLAFLVFGVLFFLMGEKNKNWGQIFLSIIFFTVSMISYYSGQAFIPVFVAGLLFIFRKSLWDMIRADKKVIVAIVIFGIFLIPIFWSIFSPQALIRFQGTSTFKPEAHSETFAKRVELWNKAVGSNDLIGTIIYSRHLFPIQVFIEGYISHFNPEWLFTNPTSQSHKVPNMGLLYLWEIPFIAIGFIAFLIGREVEGKAKKLILLWFFIAAVPASIATQVPHAMRSYNFLPTWQIFSAFGLTSLFYKFQKRQFKIAALSVFIFFVVYSLSALYKNYFVVFPKEQSSSFQYALTRAIPYVLSKQQNYEKIIFSNEDSLYQSYMFLLFHSRYDPALYQKQGGTISGGFAETHNFGKYEFRPIEWEKEKERGLYVGNVSDFPKETGGLMIFSNLDGKEAIKVVVKK